VSSSSAFAAAAVVVEEDDDDKASTEAALCRTEEAFCSICSVVLERGVRCGCVVCAWARRGREEEGIGSMSRSKIADDGECLFGRLLVSGV
jgi:hypothetical protein